jgi:PAS domain S-box-containing protein
MVPSELRRLVGIGVVVTAAYVVAARLGFQVAFIAEQVTTVWAPTGIALAALLLGGRRLWPAVWVGAWLANALTVAPLWTAALIATGNTLEAVAAVWILERIAAFDSAFRRVRDAASFIVFAALLAPTVSATIGVATLCAAAVQPWNQFSGLWFAWWLGDTLGALVVAPLLLTTLRRPTPTPRGQWVETALLLTIVTVVTEIVFGQLFGPTLARRPLQYIVFPFAILAAVRLGQPATSLVVFGTSLVAIWNTVLGVGPFASSEVHESLIFLQAFMGILAGTGLLLAAAIAERQTGERRRAAALAVGEVLAQTPDLPRAAPLILQRLSQTLEWDIAALWLVDNDIQRLRCLTVWSNRGTTADSFARATQEMLFQTGVGLPGRVWATGRPAWIEDVVRDPNFPRAAVARDAGVHGGFAFPIRLSEDVLGVIECFTATVVTPDPDLLDTMSTVGQHVGQFIARTRVETDMRDEQRRTQAIVDTALDAIVGMDHRGVITAFNPAAERIFGYSRSQVIGRELSDLLIPPELRQQHRDGLARYRATGHGPFIDRRVETRGWRADGQDFPVEVAITRVSDDPPTFTGFVRDLTSRVQAQQERETLLQRELSALRDAESANRAKDDFLATLSHELRTPLNAILGWTRMLLDGTMDENSSRKALQVIDRNAHLQAQLVADILDVSRIITGGLRLHWQPVDLGSVIGATLDAVRPAADAKQVQLRSRLDTVARLTEGDPQRLQQIVWNLLSNAVKFTPAGGTISIELDDIGDGGIRIRVQDSGAGIEPAFLPHVFERFRQADNSVSRQHGGLGLGLAIVRHLVELHGGTVRADSPGVGQGSVFTIDLPRVDPERVGQPPTLRSLQALQAAAGRSHSTNPTLLKWCRVLVVDDEADTRELIAVVLESAGAVVQTASSVSEALGHLKDAQFDVVLADIGMPGVDGYAFIRDVRESEIGTDRHLPVAATTAYASQRDRERALAAGFDRHIAKPISPAEVIEAVLSLCRRGESTGVLP